MQSGYKATKHRGDAAKARRIWEKATSRDGNRRFERKYDQGLDVLVNVIDQALLTSFRVVAAIAQRTQRPQT